MEASSTNVVATVRSEEVEHDRGKTYIDQNAARSPTSSLEPMLQASYATNSGLVWKDTDVITCRNSLTKLHNFAIGESKDLQVEV